MAKAKSDKTRTCARCDRPVGLIGANRARPYTHQIGPEGVSVICTKDRGSCRRARLNREAKAKQPPTAAD